MSTYEEAKRQYAVELHLKNMHEAADHRRALELEKEKQKLYSFRDLCAKHREIDSKFGG